MLPLPLDFPGARIDGAQRTPERRGIIVRKIRAAVIRMPWLIGLRRRAENIALFARGHIKETSLRVERWRHPVGRSSRTRTDAATIRRRRRFFGGNRAPLGILAATPRNLGIRARRN